VNTPAKLTEPMAKVLGNLERGQNPYAHAKGRSQCGGLTRTIHFLQKRQYIRPEYKDNRFTGRVLLTDAGRLALEAWRKQFEPK
jgi:hypothetical protein